MKTNRLGKLGLVAALAGTLLTSASANAQSAKNIFVMISDGASFGAWDAGSIQQYGATASAPYYGAEYKKFLMTTYPMNMSATPTNNTDQLIGYDSAAAWGLSSYNTSAGYLHQNAVDSASAGTALTTGQKTYNSAINWSNLNQAITPNMPELAKAQGKVVGTISSVQWSHATPAAFSDAHDVSRNNYAAIANDMLNGNVMDVIMGAGNPGYTDNGAVKTGTLDYKYVGGQSTWEALNAGTHTNNWALVQEKSSFEALANGDLSSIAGKDRLVGTAQVATTLQQARSGYANTDTVGGDPLNANVPTLEVMTKAALNVLKNKDSGQGMFLQIEGGAVDWAAHANQTSRLVEEQVDFNLSVAAVTTWIEANGGWGENLLIITTDHGNSMPSGDMSSTIAHDRIDASNLAAGTFVTGTNETGVKWWSTNHTNELVPLFARGAGADMFASLVDGTDTNFATYYPDWVAAGFDGSFVDNTDVFTVTASASAVPEPSTYALMGLGAVLVAWTLRRRRNA